jgi:hypothetical protein
MCHFLCFLAVSYRRPANNRLNRLLKYLIDPYQKGDLSTQIAASASSVPPNHRNRGSDQGIAAIKREDWLLLFSE